MLTILGLIALFLPVIYILADGFYDRDSRRKELDSIRARLEEKDSEKALRTINANRETPMFLGDTVKIADAPASSSIGIAGMHGVIDRAATSSTMDANPIGTRFSDAAVRVFLVEHGKCEWLYPNLVLKIENDGESDM